MKAEEFTEVVHAQFNMCEDILDTKAHEYATGDRLHNFKMAAELQGISPRRALAGMMAKHVVSIFDMCSSDIVYSKDQWDEKITDNINYLVLLQAIVIDEEMSVILPGNPIEDFLNSIEDKNA